MPKPIRFALVALATFMSSFSFTGCSDEPTCEDDWTRCPLVIVNLEEVNECVDSANAFQLRIRATHPRIGFPRFFRWTCVPVGFLTTLYDTLAENEYCVKITQAPGSEPIQLGETAGFGIEFAPGSEVLLRQAVFLRDTLVAGDAGADSEIPLASNCYDVTPCPSASGVGVLIDYDLSAGLQMEVFNANDASGADPVVLAELEWAAATDTLPLANLVWGDSLLESLTWISPATNLPVTLLAGQPPLVYDIPDDDVYNSDVVLVRVSSSSPALVSRCVVQGDMRLAGSAVRHRTPPEVHLIGNFPDPFSESTTIQYVLDRPEDVVVDIYDVRGKHVARIKNPRVSSGHQSIVWNGRDDRGREVRSGVYFYRLRAGEFSATKKMVVVR